MTKSKLAPDRDESRITLAGFGGVFFRCPRCLGKFWGTSGDVGHCNTPGCRFRWPRDLDWLNFRRVADGSAFESPEAFESLINEREGNA